jgi:hypothetical protein
MITHDIYYRSLLLFRGTLPIDTGNLRYNASYGTYFNSGFSLLIDGDKAPYFEKLDGTGHSKQYPSPKGFEDETFAPVFAFLLDKLQGKFAGGRFIKQKDLMVYSPNLHQRVETLSASNSAREQLASQIRG